MDEDMMVTYDGFPKGNFHLLVVPRETVSACRFVNCHFFLIADWVDAPLKACRYVYVGEYHEYRCNVLIHGRRAA